MNLKIKIYLDRQPIKALTNANKNQRILTLIGLRFLKVVFLISTLLYKIVRQSTKSRLKV